MLEALLFILSFLTGYVFGRQRGKGLALRYLTIEQLKMRHDDLQKILEYLSAHDCISDENVEKIFNVPRQVANAYLKDLEHQGLIFCMSKKDGIEKYVLK